MFRFFECAEKTEKRVRKNQSDTYCSSIFEFVEILSLGEKFERECGVAQESSTLYLTWRYMYL